MEDMFVYLAWVVCGLSFICLIEALIYLVRDNLGRCSVLLLNAVCGLVVARALFLA